MTKIWDMFVLGVVGLMAVAGMLVLVVVAFLQPASMLFYLFFYLLFKKGKEEEKNLNETVTIM